MESKGRPKTRLEDWGNPEPNTTNLGEEEIQTKQISAEIVELTGSKETGQSNNQKTIVQESRTTNNEPGSDQPYKTRDTKPKTETKKQKSDLDQSYKVRDTKIAKLTPETSNRANTGQGGNGDNNAVVTKTNPDHRT